MILVIAIIACLTLGIFEVWVFRQTSYEEDYLIAGICFVAALFLGAVLLSGAWG